MREWLKESTQNTANKDNLDDGHLGVVVLSLQRKVIGSSRVTRNAGAKAQQFTSTHLVVRLIELHISEVKYAGQHTPDVMLALPGNTNSFEGGPD